MLQGKKCLEISIFQSWNKYLLLKMLVKKVKLKSLLCTYYWKDGSKMNSSDLPRSLDFEGVHYHGVIS